ncbi:beta-galactosidase [Streptomyces sp. NBC_01242]|uniref:beta-galactosidase n=1 Tax=Streptomyces sp. NBC_01242 TaxID=2903795 RepID=UPI00225AFB73|nr:beta-galactosidase [Streptomyces sp. NBC_01242]MCX4793146.1 beta-galactosidase [Streptomyces sp. NBC_01242]
MSLRGVRRRLLHRCLATGTAIALLGGLGVATGATAASQPIAARASQSASPAGTAHSVTYDDYSFKIDGKRTYLWSGEFHYFRLPSQDLWLDVLQKMKAAGFNAVSVYFDWGYHSPAPGVYDFTGVRDVDKLLDMADQLGIYVIARPGPYINAEVDGGGFPAWLHNKVSETRTTDPEWLKYSDEYQTQIDRILARHQLTNGTGTVIQYQVENEFYDSSAGARAYMKHLEDKARADGISVPLVGNNDGTFNSGTGALDVDMVDSYPQGFECDNPSHWNGVPDISYNHPAGRPVATMEFQGGAFDWWAGPGYDKCAQMVNDKFADVFFKQNIAVGATMQNIYMTYGGTNWGWLGMMSHYTSYDYGAAIRETRQLDPKYNQEKLIGYFTQAVAPLTKTNALPAVPTDNPKIVDTARANPDTGTQFHVLRHTDSTATSTDSAHLKIDLGAGGRYTVPQQPGTSLTLNGRQSSIIVANYDLGSNNLLRYSTSQIMTNATIGGRDVAVLYGDHDSDGETVLHYGTKPTVTSTGGSVTSTWDADTGDLRLNYRHTGLTKVQISGGGHPLQLLLADTATAKTFWRQDTAAGPVLVRGTHLLRGASSDGTTLALNGDTGTDGSVEVWSTTSSLTWNGRKVHTSLMKDGGLTATLPTAAEVTVPALTGWKHAQESPESQPGFNDSSWQVADKTTSKITTPATLPVLSADDYGFHTGSTWYRGRFTGDSKTTGITLAARSSGKAAASSVWLNGTFLGSSTDDGKKTYTFPAGVLKTGSDNVISVLTVNMGHDENWGRSDSSTVRGLTSATLVGDTPETITWRLQGVRGGETPVDTVRGPLATGGLYGERAGWMLPHYPTDDWTPTTLPATDTTPGVSWYATDVALDLPKGQDTSLGLTITDDPSRKYRAEIYVNGWHMGNYVNYLGPQHSFPVPNGILNPNGNNRIAIAAWNIDGSTGGLGKVELTNYGSYASSLKVAQNDSPRYDKAQYAMPAAPRSTVALQVPGTVAGGHSFTATTTVSVPADAPPATEVTAALAAPDGWTVTPHAAAADPVRVAGGASATFTWDVTAPAALGQVNPLTTTVQFVQGGRSQTVADERIVIPPQPVLLPQSKMSVADADSQETAGENAPAANVLDGDPGTFWHTQWSGTTAPMPHEIQLNLGGDNTVSCLYYLPRQDGANGRIAKYEVYTSKDGTAWGDPVATGTWTNTSTEQKACFTPVGAHYIRLRALSEVNGNPFTTAAEINVG